MFHGFTKTNTSFVRSHLLRKELPLDHQFSIRDVFALSGTLGNVWDILVTRGGPFAFQCVEVSEKSMLVAWSCSTLCDPMACSPPGSSVHEILQAGILEWVAISFSSGSSWPRDWIHVSCIAGRFFTIWATRKALISCCCCSVVKSFPTVCNPTDYSTPGLPVLHYLLEFAQIHVHWVDDAIELSHLYC